MSTSEDKIKELSLDELKDLSGGVSDDHRSDGAYNEGVAYIKKKGRKNLMTEDGGALSGASDHDFNEQQLG